MLSLFYDISWIEDTWQLSQMFQRVGSHDSIENLISKIFGS